MSLEFQKELYTEKLKPMELNKNFSKITKKFFWPIVVLLTALLIIMISKSCVSYSFTGADIPLEAKTFSVKYFQNNASLVQPALSQKLTNKLKDRMLSQTNLLMIDTGADMMFEGEIVNYTLQPLAIQGNETAQLTQLTVTVNIRFFNKLNPNNNYENRFTRFQQFASSQNLSAIEDQLLETITDELVDDIFNKAFVNW